MIEVQGLHKSYGPFQALRGIDFSVEKGTIAGFLGPNGAGKSTTMRILTTFLPPTLGRAAVAGLDVMEEPEKVCRTLGYLPESMPIYPELRVLEYLKFRATLRHVERSKLRSRVDQVIEECALGSVRRKLCGALSKGYRQRLGLADALIHDPDVLILDEPTSGLDPGQVIGVRELIKGFRGQRTVLLSSHVLSTVEDVCDEIIVVAEGEIRFQGSRRAWENQARKLAERTARVTLGKPEAGVEKILRSAPGVKSVSRAGDTFVLEGSKPLGAELARFVVDQDWELLEFTQAPASLEKLFLNLTGPRDRASVGGAS